MKPREAEDFIKKVLEDNGCINVGNLNDVYGEMVEIDLSGLTKEEGIPFVAEVKYRYGYKHTDFGGKDVLCETKKINAFHTDPKFAFAQRMLVFNVYNDGWWAVGNPITDGYKIRYDRGEKTTMFEDKTIIDKEYALINRHYEKKYK